MFIYGRREINDTRSWTCQKNKRQYVIGRNGKGWLGGSSDVGYMMEARRRTLFNWSEVTRVNDTHPLIPNMGGQ